MMNKTPLASIVAVILISGCVNGTGFLFGQTGTTVEASDDVLLINNVLVVPTPPIQADSTFDLTFIVENTGDAETGKEATNVEVLGFDWGRCHPQGELDENKNLAGIEGQPVTIFPGGGAQLIEWTFLAPTNDELGRVQGVCTLRYKVEYDFRAFTVTDLAVVDAERLREANRAGETISVIPVTSRSRGPLKIQIGVGADQPVRENGVVPLNFLVEDKGVGLMRMVPKGDLTVTFPPEFEGKVNCDLTAWEGSGVTYTNKIDMQFIKKKTPPLRCDVQAPDVSDLKTFSLRGDLSYRYAIFSETDVRIEPTVVGVGGAFGAGSTGGTEGTGGGEEDFGETPGT